jgi:hypothetical protein
VHGIGEQHRGETAEKPVTGLRAALGDALDVRRDDGGHAASLRVNGIEVRLFAGPAGLTSALRSTLNTSIVGHPGSPYVAHLQHQRT